MTEFNLENLYGVGDETDFPIIKFIVSKHKKIPEIYIDNIPVTKKFYNKNFFYKNNFEIIYEAKSFKDDSISNRYIIYYNDLLKIYIKLVFATTEAYHISDWNEPEDTYSKIYYEIYSLENSNEVDSLIKRIYQRSKKYKYLNNTNNLGKIKLLCNNDQGKLKSQTFKLDEMNMDIELNYGKNFVDKYEYILEILNEEKSKGLFLFHGKPGTGKTSLIRQIAHKVDKPVIFIPPYLVEAIGSPEFIPFLMDNQHSILVIEDAEKAILDRSDEGSNNAVSNILNLTDGLVGDVLSIQIIATFNVKKDQIDQALLRPGRLTVEHKFEELSVEDSNNLLKHLNIDMKVDKPHTLAEIYNINKKQFKEKEKEITVGFKFNK